MISIAPASAPYEPPPRAPNRPVLVTATLKGAKGRVTWSASRGAITSDGHYTAPANEGSSTVTAFAAGLTVSAPITVKAAACLP